jgi:hypothetical protein
VASAAAGMAGTMVVASAATGRDGTWRRSAVSTFDVPSPSRTAWTSLNSAPASVGRAPGSRRVARATSLSRTAGEPGVIVDGAGTSLSTCCQATSTGSEPSNGTRPVSISKSTMPAE